MKISFEKARNNEWTCKLCTDDYKEQYIYSKYRPKESIKVQENIKEDSNYIVLGLGLGYEVDNIASRTKGIVYIVEPNNEYLKFIMNQEELRNLINHENIKILIGLEYKEVDKSILRNCEMISNDHLVKYQISYFGEFMSWLRSKSHRERKNILVVDHSTIAQDCISALKSLDYNIKVIPHQTSIPILLNEIGQFKADYIFTINFSSPVARLCETYRLPYISWTVDTPSYDLYEEEVNLSYSIKFVYDQSIVEDLRKQGIQNVYHLPVAVDSTRMAKVLSTIDEADRLRYSCDIGFVANLTKSEYTQQIASYMNLEDRKYIDYMIEEQNKDTSVFAIKQSVREGLAERLKNKYGVHVKMRPYLKYEDSIAFLMGRYHSEVERVKFSKELESHFKVKVFGNKEWEDYIECYAGHAEHYTEMPKAFHLAKVNLNMTRCFVESGLPMRVFDVLGAQGFLLTNYKTEIEQNFSIGKDLVVYRDLKDAIEITEYYLHHEEERQEIIRHGYRTVAERHTYEQRIHKIMEIVEQCIEGME